jgi:hypothetical protein
MEPPILWLKQQLDKAQKDYNEAKKRLEAVEIVMSLAVEDAKRKMSQNKARSQGRTLRLAEEALANKPLSSGELQALFSSLGYATTTNSVNTSLNRYRGRRFQKDSRGRWHLMGASQMLLLNRMHTQEHVNG